MIPRMQMKSMFIDRLLIEKKIDEATAKRAGKAGVILKRDARASIKIRAATTKQRERLNHPDPKVRQRALKAIEAKEKERSRPGAPPFARTRDRTVTLRNIQYGYDHRRRSLVVGAVGLGRSTGQTVPELMEHGGSVAIDQWWLDPRSIDTAVKDPKTNRWRDKKTNKFVSGPQVRMARGRWVPGKPRNSKAKTRRHQVRVAARPFMGPAFARKSNAILDAWKGAVKA